MTVLLFFWFMLLVALLIFVIGRRHDGGALTLAYFLGLSLIHVPGALVHVWPGWDLYGEEETVVGFQITLMGLAAFVTGGISARLYDKRNNQIQVPVVADGLND